MMTSGRVAGKLREKLEAAFAPSALEIEDESSRHAGHSGAREGGESHFRVRIVSDAFAGLSRVERQRRVYAIVKHEIDAGLHALALTTLTPEEAARNG
jgi:BolA protein